MGKILAGGSAGVLSAMIVYPIDHAKTQLQSDILSKNSTQRRYSGLRDCLRKIYAKDGLKGTYKGFQLTPLSVFVYRGL